jgi:hypothetical protein
MIFLIEYNRTTGSLVNLRKFAESEKEKAKDARLELELDLHKRDIEHEVVILEAASEAAIRKTHRRYFEDLKELLQPLPA